MNSAMASSTGDAAVQSAPRPSAARAVRRLWVRLPDVRSFLREHRGQIIDVLLYLGVAAVLSLTLYVFVFMD